MWMTKKRRATRANAMTVNLSRSTASETKLDDAELELLGNYFTDERIRDRMWLTFEHFVALYQAGRWYERVV
jgi:hypothetical protein